MFIHMHKAYKQNPSSSKLKRVLFLHEKTWLQQQVKNILGWMVRLNSIYWIA